MSLFKVLETSFIGLKLSQPGDIVEINTDVANGGMTPGANLAECDEDGNVLAEAPAKKKKGAAPAAPADLG